MNKSVIVSTIMGCVLAASCSDDLGREAPAGSCTITAAIDDQEPSSRTCVDVTTYDNPDFVGIMWTAGDSIGVFSESSANALFRNTASTSSRKTDFTGDIAGQPLYAYYPYLAANAGRSADDLIGEVRVTQPFALGNGVLYDDFKVGHPEAGSTTRFNFTHLFSLLRFSVDASGTVAEGEHLDYVKLTVSAPDGSARSIAGKFHFDATAQVPSYSNVSQAKDEITMKWTDTPLLNAGNTYTGFMTAIPDIKAGDRLTITVATDSRLLSFAVDCAKDFESGYVYTFPMTLDLYEGKEEYGWKESARASISKLSFTAAANSGKILDKKVVCSGTGYTVNSVTQEDAAISGSNIDCTIPYLFDFRLTPSFIVADGAVVTVDGLPVVSGKTMLDFSGPVTMTVTTEEDSRDYTVVVGNSGLPVVVLSQSASGDFSEVKDGGFMGIGGKVRNRFLDFMIRGKETDWVSDDKITVYNPDGSIALAEAPCGLRQRGNTTRKYPKKALAIKLASKSAILGMPKSKRFVLLANWLDHSMIRNNVAFTLAHLIQQGVTSEGLEPGIPWNPSGRNVELVIDGRHVGNYLLGEQIKLEKNRLNINDSYEDRLADGLSTAEADCGYLFEFDQNYDEIWKFATTGGSNLPVMIKDDAIGDNTALWNSIQTKINGIDRNITSGNYSGAYKDFDIYSAIDQMIVYELTQNREYTEPRSVYYFINGTGKLTAGPVWDFDRGTFHNPSRASGMGNESNRIKPYDRWLFEFSSGSGETFNNKTTTPGVWYRQLIKDPVFKATLKTRWQKLLPYLQMLPGEIERLAIENQISWSYNNAMWPTTSAARKAGNDNNTFKDWSGDEDFATYDEVIANMIECYNSRLAGLDNLIKNL